MGDIVGTPENGASDPADNEQKETGGDGSEEGTDDNQTPVTNEGTEGGEKQPVVPSEDDNNTTDPTEGDETTPEEPVVQEPVVPEESVPEEPDRTVDNDGVVALSEAVIEFEVTLDGNKVEAANVGTYVKDITNVEAENKVSSTADVTFKLNTEELMVGSVGVKLDGATEATPLTADTDGVYTVTGSSSATASVAVSIALTTKTYAVNVPASNEEATKAQVTWKIKKADDQNYGTTAVNVKKGESVELEATLAANADNVAITVPGAEPATATLKGGAEEQKAEFTVVINAAMIEALEQNSNALTAEYVVTKADAEVLFAGTKGEGGKDTAAFGTDFKVQYRTQDEKGKFGAWTSLSEAKLAAKKDDVIQLKIEPGAKLSVSGVKFGASSDVVNPEASVDGEDEDIYQIKVVAPASPVAKENTVEVALAAAQQITLKGADGAQIQSVQWSADNGSNWNNTRRTNGGWAADIAADATEVSFKVVAKKYYKVTNIDFGTHTDKDCKNCLELTSSDSNKTVTASHTVANGAELTSPQSGLR